MFKFIGNFLRNWSVGVSEREILNFIKCLKGQSGEELAFTLVHAFHFKNRCKQKTLGVDLMDPILALQLRPNLRADLFAFIKEYQRTKQLCDAAGVMIWLHSIRAIDTPELRIHGREMWGQLARGLGYLKEQALAIKSMTNNEIYIEENEGIPLGLEPN